MATWKYFIKLSKLYSTAGYNNVENGIVRQPLARNNGAQIVYSKESAAVKFIPEADYFRGGLGFFTNNTGNEKIDA